METRLVCVLVALPLVVLLLVGADIRPSGAVRRPSGPVRVKMESPLEFQLPAESEWDLVRGSKGTTELLDGGFWVRRDGIVGLSWKYKRGDSSMTVLGYYGWMSDPKDGSTFLICPLSLSPDSHFRGSGRFVSGQLDIQITRAGTEWQEHPSGELRLLLKRVK